MSIKKWQKISSTRIFDHPRLHLLEDTVLLPDGKRTTYVREAPVTQHSVAIIAVDSMGRLLLQKEYSYPPDTIMWQLPADP